MCNYLTSFQSEDEVSNLLTAVNHFLLISIPTRKFLVYINKESYKDNLLVLIVYLACHVQHREKNTFGSMYGLLSG